MLLLAIICAADVGAWFFGKMFGGDKMWERISANKTWVGQIAGIVSGAIVALAFGPLVVGNYFMFQSLDCFYKFFTCYIFSLYENYCFITFLFKIAALCFRDYVFHVF